MIVKVQELDVAFPYEFVYPEQYQYMLHLKTTLDGSRGHCLLEMPTGTGKTVTLLSFILAYQAAHPDVGKLIYCTRTVQEMDKVVAELDRVVNYRKSLLQSASASAASAASAAAAASSQGSEAPHVSTAGAARAGGRAAGEILGVCLSSRRNLCIHEEVSRFDVGSKVDAMCRNLTASFVREKAGKDVTGGGSGSSSNSSSSANPANPANPASPADPDADSTSKTAKAAAAASAPDEDIELCDFYEGYMATGSDAMLTGILSLERLQTLGRERKWCPYFLARHLINLADVVVYNYQYMLDPKISGMVSREMGKDSIVVFDEAHNIDNVCIEALSVELNRQTLAASTQNVRRLTQEVRRMEKQDAERLNREYQQLVRGLRLGGALASNAGAGPIEIDEGDGADDDGGGASSVPPPEDPAAADVVAAAPVLSQELLSEAMPGNIRRAKHFVRFLRTLIEWVNTVMQRRQVVQWTPAQLLLDFRTKTHMAETRALRYTFDRLNSLVRTLRLTNVDEFTPVMRVANFATLLASYSEGFCVLFEPYDDRTPTIPDPVLQLCCLDASLAVRPVFERFRNVVITSGTLSPLDMFPKILNFDVKVSASLNMSLTRNCICPMIVTKGSDQVPICSKFDMRDEAGVLQNYGRLLIDMAATVPDGMVCFFTSYYYMESTIMQWNTMGILEELQQHKLVFIETKDVAETSMALTSFRQACDSGKGAVFLSVARGKVAEGIDFDRHYGRCVLLFGIPFQYTLSRPLHARMLYLFEKFQIQEGEFLTFDAMRQASQCVGRVIRSKLDYGLMVFADMRYSRMDKRRKLPQWITQYLDAEHMNLSTDGAITLAQGFLRKMAQPRSRDDDIGYTMLTEAQVLELNKKALPVEEDPDGDVAMADSSTT